MREKLREKKREEAKVEKSGRHKISTKHKAISRIICNVRFYHLCMLFDGI